MIWVCIVNTTVIPGDMNKCYSSSTQDRRVLKECAWCIYMISIRDILFFWGASIILQTSWHYTPISIRMRACTGKQAHVRVDADMTNPLSVTYSYSTTTPIQQSSGPSLLCSHLLRLSSIVLYIYFLYFIIRLISKVGWLDCIGG